jgi:ribosomal protein S18 acetylase RimI-like enzyme
MPDPAPAGIRPAGTRDIPGVEACTRRAYAVHTATLGYPPKPVDADYADYVARGDLFVIDGACGIAGALAVDQNEADLLVYSIAIDPSQQGRGFGSLLLDFAERQAAERGLRKVTLYTNERMEGNVGFYERRGYTVFARLPHATRPNSWAIHMEKELGGRRGIT